MSCGKENTWILFRPDAFFLAEFAELLLNLWKLLASKRLALRSSPERTLLRVPFACSDGASCSLRLISPRSGTRTRCRHFLSYSEYVFNLVLFGNASGSCLLKKAEMVIMN